MVPLGQFGMVSNAISRAALLRGRLVATAEKARPPYAVAEADFRSHCERCDDCRNACEADVIGRDKQGFPFLRFNHAKCSFCGACAEACTTGALSPEQARAWTITAHVQDSCLSVNAITCRACEESCETRAIRFQLMTGGRALPLVDGTKCTGCGNCAVICPNRSIQMSSGKPEEAFT